MNLPIPAVIDRCFKEKMEIPAELAELGSLMASINDPRRDAINSALRRAIDSAMNRQRILDLVEEALSELRVDIKYLLFDLEATRREREELRQQLEDR